MTLRDMIRYMGWKLRNGYAWVIFYREKRSWYTETVYLQGNELQGNGFQRNRWRQKDLAEAAKILKIDPNAVLLNGYYCGHLAEDMTIDELAAGVRWHYENGYNQLRSIEGIPPLESIDAAESDSQSESSCHRRR